MNTQSHHIGDVAASPFMSMRNLHASLLDDDAPSGCDTKAAQSWEHYLQDPSHNVGEPQLVDYRNSGQDFKQSFDLLPNGVSEDQDDPASIRQLNMDDFHRINRRAQRGIQAQTPQFVFSHKKFQRDSPELLEDKRKGIEPQDAPPSYETLLSVGKPVLGMPTSTQALVADQPELRDILEFQRLRNRIASFEGLDYLEIPPLRNPPRNPFRSESPAFSSGSDRKGGDVFEGRGLSGECSTSGSIATKSHCPSRQQ